MTVGGTAPLVTREPLEEFGDVALDARSVVDDEQSGGRSSAIQRHAYRGPLWCMGEGVVQQVGHQLLEQAPISLEIDVRANVRDENMAPGFHVGAIGLHDSLDEVA